MNWIEQLMVYRRTARSNVILVETIDPKRLEQFVNWSKANFKKGDRIVPVIIHYDLQLGKGKVIRSTEPLSLEEDVTLYDLDNIIKDKATLLVVSWVIDSELANKITPILFSWSQSPEVYMPKTEMESNTQYKMPSTIVVFTHSLSFFSDNVRRVMAEVVVPPSTPEERRARIEQVAISAGIDTRTITSEVINASAGLNLHEVETATLESIALYGEIKKEVYTKMKIDILKRYGIRYIEPKRGFESVGGYSLLKEWFKRNVISVLANPDKAGRYGVEPPRGIILYGYPGCGKTWFAKALAKELGYPFIQLDASDFLRGIVGETEARTRQIIQILESMAPAIVFIDEIDQLFLARSQYMSTDSGVTRRLQNMLLEWLGDEDRKTFLIGATNYIEQMDFAAIRVGRIDKIVLVLPPDYNARKEIFKIHVEMINKPKIPVEIDYDEVARMTYMWTGAELEALARETKMEALRRNDNKITTEHVKESMKVFKINIAERKKNVRRMIEVANTLENVDHYLVEEFTRVLNEEESKYSLDRAKLIW